MAGNLDNFSLGTPLAEAKDIHAKWRESAESLIAACTRIADVIAVYTDQSRDGEKRKFIGELIERGVLSKQDGRRNGKSPKLSKLITIGKNEYLQDRRIRPLLPPSYSTLYYVCQLAEQLEKADAGSATDKLAGILERHKGKLDSRTAIEELNKSKKKNHGRRRARAKKAPPSIAAMVATNKVFDLVLLTPSARDIVAFQTEYPEGYLERCFPLAHVISSEGAKAIVGLALEARHIQYAPRILALAGRQTFPQAATNPGGLKHSDSTILLTSDGISPQSRTADWSSLKGGFQELLERSYPLLRRRLHVFATEEKPGWNSLVAENCWVEVPR